MVHIGGGLDHHREVGDIKPMLMHQLVILEGVLDDKYVDERVTADKWARSRR